MADNRVSIILEARDRATKTLNDLGTRFRRLRNSFGLPSFNTQLRSVGNSLKNFTAQLGRGVLGFTRFGQAARRATGPTSAFAASVRGLLIPGGIAVGLFEAVKVIAQFDQQMKKVQAVSGATGDELRRLTETARELGATTRFTATQAADALEQLVRAGFSANQAQGALRGTLALASAGMLGLEEATTITANTLRQFKLDVEDSGKVADILAAADAAATASVSSLGEALSFVGPTAAALGISLDDTVEALAHLSNAGLQGSRAGAGLQRVLAALVNPSKEGEAVLNKFGFTIDSVRDIVQKRGGIIELFNKMAERGFDVANAFQLAEQRGGLIATTLSRVDRAGTEVAGAIDHATGSSQKMSDTIEDNLLGDFRRLLSATQEVILAAGDSGLTGILRGLVQGLTVVIRSLNGTVDKSLEVGTGFQTIAETVATLVNIIGVLKESGLVTKFFAPVIAALNKLNEIATGVIEKLRLIGRIPRETAKQVSDATTFIQKKFKDIDSIDALGKFKQTALGNVKSLQADLQKDLKELSDLEEKNGFLSRGFSSAAEVKARDDRIDFLRQRVQDTSTALEREKGVVQAAITQEKVLRKNAQNADAKAQADADAKALAARGKTEDSIQSLVAKSADAQLAILREKTNQLNAQLEDDFNNDKISFEKLTREKLKNEQKVIDFEIETKKNAIKNTKDLNEQKKLAGELVVLIAQRRGLEAQATRDLANNQKEVTKTLEDAKRELSTIQGGRIDFDVDVENIRKKFQPALNQLKEDGNQAGIDFINNFINVQAARNQVDQIFTEIDRRRQQSEIIRKGIQDQITAGLRDPLEGQKAINDERQRFGVFLSEQIPQISKWNELLKDPEVKTALIDLNNEMMQLKKTQSLLLSTFETAFQQGFAQMIQDVVRGTKTAGEALRDFIRSVADQIADLIAKLIAQKALLAIINAFSGGTSGAATTAFQAVSSSKGGLIQKFGTGGPVSGAGTSTSDSIPAFLSNKEYVVNARAVRHYGASLLEAINRMKLPKMSVGNLPITIPKARRFAEGGLATDPRSVTAGGEERNLRIVNILDPGVMGNYLSSSEGERTVLNMIQRNPNRIKRLLR